MLTTGSQAKAPTQNQELPQGARLTFLYASRNTEELIPKYGLMTTQSKASANYNPWTHFVAGGYVPVRLLLSRLPARS